MICPTMSTLLQNNHTAIFSTNQRKLTIYFPSKLFLSILIFMRKRVISTPKTEGNAWYCLSVLYWTEIYKKDRMIENTKTGATSEEKGRPSLLNNNKTTDLPFPISTLLHPCLCFWTCGLWMHSKPLRIQ